MTQVREHACGACAERQGSYCGCYDANLNEAPLGGFVPCAECGADPDEKFE